MLASRSFALWLPYRGEATLSWMRSLFARSSVAVRVIIDRGWDDGWHDSGDVRCPWPPVHVKPSVMS